MAGLDIGQAIYDRLDLALGWAAFTILLCAGIYYLFRRK